MVTDDLMRKEANVEELLAVLADVLERRLADSEAVVMRVAFHRENMAAMVKGLRTLLSCPEDFVGGVEVTRCGGDDDLSACGVHNPNWSQKASYIIKAPGKNPLWVCDRHLTSELDKALDA